MGATELRLQIHEPAAGLAAGAILVRDRAGLAAPELPPDPLEVVHLEDEEGDDPEHDFGARHACSTYRRAPAPSNGPSGPDLALEGPRPRRPAKRIGTERPSERPLRPELVDYQRRAPVRPMSPANKRILTNSGTIAATP